MHLSYWLDEVVRLVQKEGYSIRKACYRVKLRKENFENGIEKFNQGKSFRRKGIEYITNV